MYIIVDICGAMLGWNMAFGIALITTVASVDLFILHIVLGLLILTKLKSVVNEENSYRSDTPMFTFSEIDHHERHSQK